MQADRCLEGSEIPMSVPAGWAELGGSVTRRVREEAAGQPNASNTSQARCGLQSSLALSSRAPVVPRTARARTMSSGTP
jgi:hypothetical protein